MSFTTYLYYLERTLIKVIINIAQNKHNLNTHINTKLLIAFKLHLTQQFCSFTKQF